MSSIVFTLQKFSPCLKSRGEYYRGTTLFPVNSFTGSIGCNVPLLRFAYFAKGSGMEAAFSLSGFHQPPDLLIQKKYAFPFIACTYYIHFSGFSKCTIVK